MPPSALELATPIGQNAAVSFDIFLQGFENGYGAPGKPDEANRVLRPYLRVGPTGFRNVVTEDGDAEVYGVGTDGLMFAHRVGECGMSCSRLLGPGIGRSFLSVAQRAYRRRG
jgi:hypothetical protein